MFPSLYAFSFPQLGNSWNLIDRLRSTHILCCLFYLGWQLDQSLNLMKIQPGIKVKIIIKQVYHLYFQSLQDSGKSNVCINRSQLIYESYFARHSVCTQFEIAARYVSCKICYVSSNCKTFTFCIVCDFKWCCACESPLDKLRYILYISYLAFKWCCV